MSEIERILDQLRRSFEAHSWHGPAVLEALAGVDAATAAFQPPFRAHSIGELVLHMAVWKRVVTDRIQGRRHDPPTAEDWAPFASGRWRSAVSGLRAAHRELTIAAGRLKDSDLDAAPLGASTRYLLLHGAIQHDLYHAGQIVVIARAARAAAAERANARRKPRAPRS